MKANRTDAKCGLVLSGGGARGAYEAGIIYYLFVDGPRELREAVHFRVLCGTSIGALSVSALAASLHQPSLGIRRFIDLWRTLDLESILHLKMSDVMTLPGWIAGRGKKESIFPGGPVRRLIEDTIDWDQMHLNLADGYIDAVSLSCTQAPTGKTVVFYETSDGRPGAFSRDPNVRPVHARLSPDHALASAAIPFVFPAVPIDGIPYIDGGLRQNTPLSPALRLGSERLLVIGVGTSQTDLEDTIEIGQASASPVFVLAKVLNALMLDHVAYDIVRLSHVNRLLEDGERAFGAQFIDRLNEMVSKVRGASYRKIPHVVLRPSRDLGGMAAQYVRERKLRSSRSLIARAIRTLARMESRNEADLTSYLLFDGGYCEQLLELGISDAAARRDDLIRLFT